MRLFYYDVFAELYGFFDENGVCGIVVVGVAGNAPTRLHHYGIFCVGYSSWNNLDAFALHQSPSGYRLRATWHGFCNKLF
ncbi:MAG: hypothetical protein LBH25_08215 [Fibromonadaceae bacterium]|jgi:hypothetical protein|nr:hypothetical protein [Fibromonadaceae bacterium]